VSPHDRIFTAPQSFSVQLSDGPQSSSVKQSCDRHDFAQMDLVPMGEDADAMQHMPGPPS
jgi:hypothetical protein